MNGARKTDVYMQRTETASLFLTLHKNQLHMDWRMPQTTWNY